MSANRLLSTALRPAPRTPDRLSTPYRTTAASPYTTPIPCTSSTGSGCAQAPAAALQTARCPTPPRREPLSTPTRLTNPARKAAQRPPAPALRLTAQRQPVSDEETP
ncbi:hypothetical protein HYPSUDRAFT_203045 [Hypholoma sublateritium FD-334 SS-4]|uniref:Uncharacterized protein n=1 Tax=Hypholoma sublateritium (strain FD-334 SS-4) TaxID=945553 RepID=A0A0D2PN27_HYPSF|nr:hypothetical protein HYPSUDRAFT_203045 [Hypholoma sublateritium FD-334 SS-4]